MPVTAPVMKATLPSQGRSAEVIWFYPLAKTITIVSVAYKPIRESRSMSDMEQRLAALENRVGELEDINAIRRLHWAYGYYIDRSEEHTSELQSRENLVCRLLLEKKNK